MTPTPAQIEAAAKALYGNRSRDPSYNAMEMAKAALTAAAGVDCGAQAGKALTGNLNEVSLGENSESVLHHQPKETPWLSRYGLAGNELAGNVMAATIERCAQVAEQHWIPGPYNTIPQDIAAAIRALKDKP